MLHQPLLIPPSSRFWSGVAAALLENGPLPDCLPASGGVPDFSAVRVLVPAFSHARQLKAALAEQLQQPFIPPRITTLPAWLAMQPPSDGARTTANSARMMSLYAALRQHGWLKKLFAARRNTDLLPLAQTLLDLFDELTEALLPALRLAPDAADERWRAALEQLPSQARGILSDEAQLVWSLWKSQLDGSDPNAVRFAQLMRLAECAEEPLVWIGAVEPDAMESAFLAAYGERRAVLPVLPDWRAGAVAPVFAAAWGEIIEGEANVSGAIGAQAGLSLCAARNLEDEALRGAQTVIDWLQQGKSSIAIIAQDRVVARRIRALLERAQVFICDETGWKLSTTRTAASIAALLDVVATRAETAVLLDLLKSPFLFADMEDKPATVMTIETALRRENVPGGWEAALHALARHPEARGALRRIADQARLFTGRKTLAEWMEATVHTLKALGMYDALAADAAGAQLITMLEALEQDCASSPHVFSFAEWRTFLGLQLESAPFVPDQADARVVMLQLNGARLRSFDAVLMVGADAEHLPSRLNETLFFANAVRRELGLATREMRQRTQLRDFAGLLSANAEVVLSWQESRNGEPNRVSGWIERLQLALAHAGAEAISLHATAVRPQRLRQQPLKMPLPAAPHLLPHKLSASGYNSLVACPYQFFATRMLGLHALEELSELPEKRDYGDWLHTILTTYHETVRDHAIAMHDRLALLQQISETVFDEAIAKSAAALGYYGRWQKVMAAYLDWANERERQGWRFAAGEQLFEKSLQWDGGKITLQGRIDRIDENEAGERAVLDYKTRNVQALRDRLKDGDDHQLAFYGLLSDLPVAHAHYVALEALKGKAGSAEAPDFEEWQRALEERLVATVRAIAQGAPLPATGINRICRFCEVRGLCRKGGWS